MYEKISNFIDSIANDNITEAKQYLQQTVTTYLMSQYDTVQNNTVQNNTDVSSDDEDM